MTLINDINDKLAMFNYVFNGLKMPKNNLSGGSMCIDYDKDNHNSGTITFKLKKKDFSKEIQNRNSLENHEMDVIANNWKAMTVDSRIEFNTIIFDKINVIVVFKFNF